MTMFFELTSSTWNISYSTTWLLLSKISFYASNTIYTLTIHRLFDVNSEATNMITLSIGSKRIISLLKLQTKITPR
jgi:hypothetical protein